MHEKSELIITDESKIGTTLDGESFKKDSRALKNDVHTIKLGRYEPNFTIKWRPVVLTITSLKSSQKAAADPLASLREKVEKYDIKLSIEYISNVTTHVVATKRNVPPTLCGLIEGKHIVADAFVDALTDACTSRPNNDDSENPFPSFLEEDFENNFPTETTYLPPAGKEPVPRGEDYFAPNPERSTVFEGYTFIFVDQGQFDALQAMINVGNGKAILYDRFQKGASRYEDLVDYVKDQNHGTWRPGQGKGPVVVRFVIKPDDEWGHLFCNQTDVALGQRSILQNEFLDAILTNDAAALRKPLEEGAAVPSSTAPATVNTGASKVASRAVAESSSVPPPPSQISATSRQPTQQPPVPPQQSTTTIPPRRQRRNITESRFKGFDDFDAPAALVRRVSIQDSDEIMREVPETSQTSQQPQTQGRKRPAPLSDDEISDDPPAYSKRARRSGGNKDQEMRDAGNQVEKLLPAAAAMRRRKTGTRVGENGDGATYRRKTEEELKREQEKARLERARRKRDRNAEIDVGEEVRKQRRREAEMEQAEEERIRRGLEDVDVSGLRDLVEIEEMTVPKKVMEKVSREGGGNGSRAGSEMRGGREWREEWNGRKNFKGFRPKRKAGQGQSQGVPGRQKIIVALEEVKRKGFDLGEEFWGSQGDTQRVEDTQRDDDGEEDNSLFRRSRKSQSSAQKSQSQRSSKHTPRFADQIGEFHEVVGEDAPAVQSLRESHRSRGEEQELPPQTDHSLRSRVTETQYSKGQTQTGSLETQRRDGKRAAKESTGMEPPAKRGRGGRKKFQSDDDSDEDALKFRRKKR